eukprot:scaffold5448_cov113-Isochrysis_galbana.AAC.2
MPSSVIRAAGSGCSRFPRSTSRVIHHGCGHACSAAVFEVPAVMLSTRAPSAPLGAVNGRSRANSSKRMTPSAQTSEGSAYGVPRTSSGER